ncbi:MAG: quinolinate synthase NadA [Pseudomonadota bacterium]
MTKTALTFQQYFSLDDDACIAKIHELKKQLGNELFILGHYYQRDEVYQFADVTGDSLQLSFSAAKTDAKYIVFCGVHFMAEVADILTRPNQAVILPDLAAGCSMADMANLRAVQQCWDDLSTVIDPDVSVTPVTYVNSAADLKAFCGDHGGTLCTSSNAGPVVSWALGQREKILFFPDQHLGRNTAYALGIPLSDMAVWDYKKPMGGLTPDQIRQAKVLLWDGYCSVHQRFKGEHVDAYLAKYPDAQVIAHPEACFEVCQKAHHVGSTSYIIEKIKESAPGTRWLVATELNLVNRLQEQFRAENKVVEFMAPTVCMCSTMFRTDPQHLLWVLDNLAHGNIVNRVQVPAKIAESARHALSRMFDITQASTKAN